MLPPFIIEQIRKREEEDRRREANQPRLELPIDYPVPPRGEQKERSEDDVDRGVVILDLGLGVFQRCFPHAPVRDADVSLRVIPPSDPLPSMRSGN